MLVPAISRKDELEKLFAEHLYDSDMFFYNGYPYCNKIPDLTPEENIFYWAVVDKNKVIGCFSYCIDVNSDNVYRLSLYSFENNPVIGIDVYKKLKELIHTHHRIEWRMTGSNPVQRHYDRFCRHFGGNKVILHDVVKSPDGKYLDAHIYEIVRGCDTRTDGENP